MERFEGPILVAEDVITTLPRQREPESSDLEGIIVALQSPNLISTLPSKAYSEDRGLTLTPRITPSSARISKIHAVAP